MGDCGILRCHYFNTIHRNRMLQNDEVIWLILNQQSCSFKLKTQSQNFCRNLYNVSGLCNRSSCPLANSRYATIRENNGYCYLLLKTSDRAHMPSTMWRKIRLKKNYAEAMAQIEKKLQFWPKFLLHKNKQRLTSITQYLIRIQQLLRMTATILATNCVEHVKKNKRREPKAKVEARLQTTIKKDLLARLQAGTYSDIYQHTASIKQHSGREETAHHITHRLSNYFEIHEGRAEPSAIFGGVEEEAEGIQPSPS